MTIEQLGALAKSKDARYANMSVKQAGQQLLVDHPEYWSHVEDNIVAQHLTNLKLMKYREASGIWAFFASMGEKQRAQFFERRAATAQSLVLLEKASHEIADLQLTAEMTNVKIRLAVAEAAVVAKARIHQINIDEGRRKKANDEGHSLQNYDALQFREAETKIILEYNQSQAEIQKDIEKSRHDWNIQAKEKDHELRVKEKVIDHNLEQHIIDAEVRGTIRLANTAELSRQQKVQILRGYNNEVLVEPNPANKELLYLEIARLTKELYGKEESSGMAGQAHTGPEPQGGSTPPKSGNDDRGAPGSSKPPDSSEDSWHIN